MALFDLQSQYKPFGDQPKAIDDIVNNFNNGINLCFMWFNGCMCISYKSD